MGSDLELDTLAVTCMGYYIRGICEYGRDHTLVHGDGTSLEAVAGASAEVSPILHNPPCVVLPLRVPKSLLSVTFPASSRICSGKRVEDGVGGLSLNWS
jgi:hypothetical protein